MSPPKTPSQSLLAFFPAETLITPALFSQPPPVRREKRENSQTPVPWRYTPFTPWPPYLSARRIRRMETSIEKLVAVFFLVTGLSHILQPRVWVEFFIMLREKREVGSFLNGLLHFPLGAFIVSFHNVWHGWPLVVTLIGWGLVLKSLIYLTYPKHGMRMLARISVERSWEFVVAGVFAVAISGLSLVSWLRQ